MSIKSREDINNDLDSTIASGGTAITGDELNAELKKITESYHNKLSDPTPVDETSEQTISGQKTFGSSIKATGGIEGNGTTLDIDTSGTTINIGGVNSVVNIPGSLVNSALGGGSFTYFVSSNNGNDISAKRGSQTNAYQTINVAVDAAKLEYQATGFRQLVLIGKGIYKEKDICRLGVDLFFEDDTIVWAEGNDTIINDLDGAGIYKIKGKGRFYHKDPIKTHGALGNAVLVSKASEFYVEADEVSDISIIGGANNSNIDSRWNLGEYVKSSCKFNIKSILFFFELNNYDKEVNFRNTVFRSGVQLDYFQFSGNVLFEQCIFVLPEDGYDSLREVYDYDGNLLFTTSTTTYVNDLNWLDTESFTTQQEVVDQLNSNKSIGYHSDPNTKYKAAFLYKETLASSRSGKVYLNDCEIHIRRPKGVGLEVVQHYDNTGYAPADLPRGGVFINNVLVRDMTLDGEPDSGIAYVMVKDATLTENKNISLSGFKTNCSTLTLLPAGNASVASYAALSSNFTEIV